MMIDPSEEGECSHFLQPINRSVRMQAKEAKRWDVKYDAFIPLSFLFHPPPLVINHVATPFGSLAAPPLSTCLLSLSCHRHLRFGSVPLVQSGGEKCHAQSCTKTIFVNSPVLNKNCTPPLYEMKDFIYKVALKWETTYVYFSWYANYGHYFHLLA